MLSRLPLRCSAFALAAFLISCGGGNVTLAPPLNETLTVQPSALTFTVPQPQTLSVTVRTNTVVYASSSDTNIATVSPASADINTLAAGSGTAIFTVTLHSAGKAVITVRSVHGARVNIPAQASAAQKIYVSDLRTIKTYDAAGAPVSPSITDFHQPGSLAVDAAGNIYVCDDNGVVTYDASGEPTTPTLPSAGGVFSSPSDLAVIGGKIYVVTNSPGAVATYNANGTPSTPTISLFEAESIAVDAAGKIYVLTIENVLHTYEPNGTPTTPTITIKIPIPEFEGATSVAVDAAGKIYVAIDGGTVQTYTPNGSPTTPTIVTGPGAIPLQSLLPPPSSVDVDAVGKIYVTYSGTLFTYEPDGTPTTPKIVVAQPGDKYNVDPFAGLAVR